MDQRRLFADKNAREREYILKEHEHENRKMENTIARLIDMNANNYFSSRLSHLFHGWKAYVDRRRKCCKILSNALYKTAISKTFTEIREFSRDTHMTESKAKTSNKLQRLYNKFRLKAAMCRWKEQEY